MEEFIQQFEQREGIFLDADQIERNEALRSIAKLCLNSKYITPFHC